MLRQPFAKPQQSSSSFPDFLANLDGSIQRIPFNPGGLDRFETFTLDTRVAHSLRHSHARRTHATHTGDRAVSAY